MGEFFVVTGQPESHGPWPPNDVLRAMACTCIADGAPGGARCGVVWTRCNARLAAIRDWQDAARLTTRPPGEPGEGG